MAAGMSDSAFQARRRRWYAKLERAAIAAGMTATKVNSTERKVQVDDDTFIVVRFSRGNASNGETFLSEWADVYIGNERRRSFSSWGWTEFGFGAQDFFRSINNGNKLDVATMVGLARGETA